MFCIYLRQMQRRKRVAPPERWKPAVEPLPLKSAVTLPLPIWFCSQKRARRIESCG
jgi:hypothetical protein